MTGHVVVVTPQQRVEWFASERHYCNGDPTVRMTFEPTVNVWWGRTFHPTTRGMNASVGYVFRLLTNDPWADVSDVATHRVDEPGAPLEPIVREDVPA